MSFAFVGYVPKKIEPASDAMDLPGVTRILSVSECISSGPPTSIQYNELGTCPTIAEARALVPSAQVLLYEVLAYRLWSQEFDEKDEVRSIQLPVDAVLSDVDPTYHVLGYDAVVWNRYNFGCSPLSCNGGAQQFPVNTRCLFASLDDAKTGARTFANGGWEPGPYCIVEVLGLEALLK